VCVSVCVCECGGCIRTGWRRLIVADHFPERATKYRSLLRKMTNKDKESYESLQACIGRQRALICALICDALMCET